MTKTVTVTIGRNVGTNPLPAEEWNDFVFETRRAVNLVTSETWAQGPFRGSWDGGSEDSFVFYGPLTSDDTSLLSAIRSQLSTLATKYRQDAIGLSVGDAELVESFPTVADTPESYRDGFGGPEDASPWAGTGVRDLGAAN